MNEWINLSVILRLLVIYIKIYIILRIIFKILVKWKSNTVYAYTNAVLYRRFLKQCVIFWNDTNYHTGQNKISTLLSYIIISRLKKIYYTSV